MDGIFHALAHRVRRRILDLVRENDGCNVGDVCRHFAISRIAVMKHLRVLEQAGLLTPRKKGRERKLYFNAVPIQMIHDRWMSQFSFLWARRLLDVKYRVESSRPKKKE